MITLLKQLSDIFPKDSIAIGGSSARNFYIARTASSNPRFVEPSKDIDIYLNVSIARYMFRNILTDIIFKGYKVQFQNEAGDTPGDPGYYKMPHMRRRITCDVRGHGSFDFIFLDPLHVDNVPRFLMEHQASTISETCLVLSNMGPQRELKALFTDHFESVIIGKSPVTLNVHNAVCTAAQARKVVSFCNLNSLRLETYSNSTHRRVNYLIKHLQPAL